MTIWSTPRLQPETMRLSEFGASRGESMAAAGATMFAGAPMFQPGRIRELQEAEGEREDLGGMIERIQQGEDLGDVAYGPPPERPRTPIAEARERVKAEGLDGTLKLDERATIPTRALDIMIERARERRQREQVIARGPQDWTQDALNAGTSFLVGAIDPLNVASAFIPVVGELRYAKLLADAGMSLPRRAAIASRYGALSGAVGVAALQPMEAYANTQEGQDWHFAHSLQNVLFGAALGGILMGGGRVAGDVIRQRRGRALYPFDQGEIFDIMAELRDAFPARPLASDPFGPRDPLPALPERFPGFAEDARIAIADDVAGRLRAAGMAEEEIEANAAIVAARYVARAERVDADPMELYRGEGIDIRRGGAADDGGRTLMQDGEGFPLFQAERTPAPIAARLKGDELGLGEEIQRTLAEAAARFQATGVMEQPIGVETYRALREAADRFYEQNFRRAGLTVVNEATGMEIGFSRSGRKKTASTASSHLLPLVPAIPDLLRMGREIDVSGPDAAGVIYHTLAASAELAGRRFDVKLVVREMPNGTFHYSLHHEGEAAGSRPASSGRPPGEPPLEQGPGARAAYIAPGELNIALAPDSAKGAAAAAAAAVDGAPRGSITLNEGRAIVRLFGNADRSTFMHEMGHLWLDELGRDAARANVPQALKDDLGTVLRWLKVDKAEDIGVAQHEQWAQGFEQYLREGKAPSKGLAAAFESFKRWLTEIYRTLAGLDTPINDEIRGVMNRLIATDREIAEVIADLPPRAHEDAMRVTLAALFNGEPVRAGELLAAAADGDPRIAEAFGVYGRPAEAPTGPGAAWRELANEQPAFNHPDVLAASRGADSLETPASMRLPEAESSTPVGPIGQIRPDDAKGGEISHPRPSDRVAAAEQAAAEADALYREQADALPADLREAVDDGLRAIKQETDDRTEVLRKGVACLAAAGAV